MKHFEPEDIIINHAGHMIHYKDVHVHYNSRKEISIEDAIEILQIVARDDAVAIKNTIIPPEHCYDILDE